MQKRTGQHPPQKGPLKDPADPALSSAWSTVLQPMQAVSGCRGPVGLAIWGSRATLAVEAGLASPRADTRGPASAPRTAQTASAGLHGQGTLITARPRPRLDSWTNTATTAEPPGAFGGRHQQSWCLEVVAPPPPTYTERLFRRVHGLHEACTWRGAPPKDTHSFLPTRHDLRDACRRCGAPPRTQLARCACSGSSCHPRPVRHRRARGAGPPVVVQPPHAASVGYRGGRG